MWHFVFFCKIIMSIKYIYQTFDHYVQYKSLLALLCWKQFLFIWSIFCQPRSENNLMTLLGIQKESIERRYFLPAENRCSQKHAVNRRLKRCHLVNKNLHTRTSIFALFPKWPSPTGYFPSAPKKGFAVFVFASPLPLRRPISLVFHPHETHGSLSLSCTFKQHVCWINACSPSSPDSQTAKNKTEESNTSLTMP